MDPITVGIFAVFVVAIIVAVAFTMKRNSELKKNGIEADAVVSKIKENETTDSDGNTDFTYTFYVTYQLQDGTMAEAKLGNADHHGLRVGDRLRIKYLPSKPKYVILSE